MSILMTSQWYEQVCKTLNNLPMSCMKEKEYFISKDYSFYELENIEKHNATGTRYGVTKGKIFVENIKIIREKL